LKCRNRVWIARAELKNSLVQLDSKVRPAAFFINRGQIEQRRRIAGINLRCLIELQNGGVRISSLEKQNT
jgi:hypothetical protein